MRNPNIHGGGSRTNFNGLSFEKRTDFLTSLKNHKNITIKNKINYSEIYFKNKLQGYYTDKHSFYSYFLEKEKVNWRRVVSKKYLPDAVFVNKINNTVYVIEKKFQAGAGSVDEKLQTCDFKKKIYTKLIDKCDNNYKTEYYYLLNEWYEKKEYNDVKNYIKSVNCKFFIEEIDFKELGIKV
ncbi:hypothetical protein OAJ75_03545 [Candidatus Pelagibacter sp.]|nr:hypothetical protein [Candidatus Pelagibacter sp.]